MLEKIGHILYHVLIVLFPILLYYLQTIRNHFHSSWLHKGRLLGISIVILLLTISFPVSYANGFHYDFRIIAVFFSFLYIGFFQGIATVLIMLLYLYFMSDSPILVALGNYAIITIILYFLSKKYRSFPLKNKLLAVSTIYWVMTLTRSLVLIETKHSIALIVLFIFSAITWITLMLVILLIENLREQMLLQRELKRSEKLNVISQLAASVAHEVRNPMTTINGFLQLIMLDDNITEKQRSYIDLSLAELHRAQEIINDYLSLAKPNDRPCQLVNISEELTKTVELMTSYTNIQNVEVSSSIDAHLYIKGNTDEMKQVFINIIKNGIEAMNGSGKLEIKAYAEKENVVIMISDNGGGMTKEMISRIGTPFYSTKDKGTGIGLTISFQIIEQIKGKIEIKSELGTGTTFIIKLPVYNPETSGEHPEEAVLSFPHS